MIALARQGEPPPPSEGFHPGASDDAGRRTPHRENSSDKRISGLILSATALRKDGYTVKKLLSIVAIAALTLAGIGCSGSSTTGNKSTTTATVTVQVPTGATTTK